MAVFLPLSGANARLFVFFVPTASIVDRPRIRTVLYEVCWESTAAIFDRESAGLVKII
jgi:hypothetical protein